jgi:hypothetical protein
MDAAGLWAVPEKSHPTGSEKAPLRSMQTAAGK